MKNTEWAPSIGLPPSFFQFCEANGWDLNKPLNFNQGLDRIEELEFEGGHHVKLSKKESAGTFTYESLMPFSSLVDDIEDVATSSRPGMKDKLRNYPNEVLDVFEVYNRDTIPLQTYQKMGRDPVLSLAIFVTTGVASALQWSISHHDEDVAKVLKVLYEPHHDAVVRNIIRTGLKFGFAFAEKVWERKEIEIYEDGDDGEKELLYDGMVVGFKKIKFIDPSNSLDYYMNQSDELVYVEQNANNFRTASSKVRVKRDKLFWFTCDEEFSNIFGNSRFKNVYPNWFYDKVVYQLMVKHIDQVGSPKIEARYPETAKVQVGNKVVSPDIVAKGMVRSYNAHGAFVAPSTRDEAGNYIWTIEYKQPQNSSLEVYKEYFDHSDKRKLMSLGFPPSTLLESNYSDSDAKNDVFMLTFEDLVNQIEEAIERDLIRALASYNFGPKVADHVTFKIDRGSLGRQKSLKEVFLKGVSLLTSMPDKPSVVPDLRSIGAELGINMVSYDSVFSDTPKVDKAGPDMAQQDQANEKSNNEHRTTKTERDPIRRPDRKSSLDSSS